MPRICHLRWWLLYALHGQSNTGISALKPIYVPFSLITPLGGVYLLSIMAALLVGRRSALWPIYQALSNQACLEAAFYLLEELRGSCAVFFMRRREKSLGTFVLWSSCLTGSCLAVIRALDQQAYDSYREVALPSIITRLATVKVQLRLNTHIKRASHCTIAIVHLQIFYPLQRMVCTKLLCSSRVSSAQNLV